jgi:hypothetical protein
MDPFSCGTFLHSWPVNDGNVPCRVRGPTYLSMYNTNTNGCYAEFWRHYCDCFMRHELGRGVIGK